MKKLLIIGAGGHGRVVAEIALKMNRWEDIKFLDDNETIRNSMGFDVIGKVKEIINSDGNNSINLNEINVRKNNVVKYLSEYDFFIAIGNNDLREKIHSNLKSIGATIPNLIHPRAIIGMQVEIGKGTAVMAGAVINCGAKIGEGCIINTGATVDHDCIIKDYVHISPGSHLAGAVKIGRGSWIGIGALVNNNIEIVSRTIIGSGALVIKDIFEGGTYVGVPAVRVK